MNIQHPTSNIERPMLQRARAASVPAIIFATAAITQAAESDATRYSRELPSATRPWTGKWRVKIEELMIPKAEFRDATVREAIEYLKRCGSRGDNFGVNLVMRLDSQPPSFSLKLENVSYLKALDAICAKAGLFGKIGNYTIVVGSRDYVSKSQE